MAILLKERVGKQVLKQTFRAISLLMKRAGVELPKEAIRRRMKCSQPERPRPLKIEKSEVNFGEPAPFIKLDREGRTKNNFALQFRKGNGYYPIDNSPPMPLARHTPRPKPIRATVINETSIEGGAFDQDGQFHGDYASYGYRRERFDTDSPKLELPLPFPIGEYDKVVAFATKSAIKLYTTSWPYLDRRGTIRYFPASTIRRYNGKYDYSEIDEVVAEAMCILTTGEMPKFCENIKDRKQATRCAVKGTIKRVLFGRLKNRVRSVDNDKLLFIERHVIHKSSLNEEEAEREEDTFRLATSDWQVISESKVVKLLPSLCDAEDLASQMGGKIKAVIDSRDRLPARFLMAGFTAAETCREIQLSRNIFQNAILRMRKRLRPYFEDRMPKPFAIWRMVGGQLICHGKFASKAEAEIKLAEIIPSIRGECRIVQGGVIEYRENHPINAMIEFDCLKRRGEVI